MPKIYEQQITAQATDFSNVKYDKIQDYITPALEHATDTMNKATDALVRIGDRRAASELEQAAKDAADEITNWPDFSDPATTIEKMVASGMKKYDDVMSKMDRTVRNRIELYNPKAREIFEVKVKEQATNAAFTYSYKDNVANLDNEIGKIIEEIGTQDPDIIKEAIDDFIEGKQNTMRPADRVVFNQMAKTRGQEGMVEWYLAFNDLNRALLAATEDKYTGDVNEVTRAKWIKSIKSLQNSSGGTGSSSNKWKTNYVDLAEGAPEKAVSTMARLSMYAETGAALPDELKEDADKILAGGKTYNELMAMPRSERMSILRANNEMTMKSSVEQGVVNRAFMPMWTEFNQVADEPETKEDSWKLKDKADITRLKDLVQKFESDGYAGLLVAGTDDKKKNAYASIKDILDKEKAAQIMSIEQVGIDMSFVYNDPHMEGFFDAPLPTTKEQAKIYNTPENMHRMSLIQKGNMTVAALNKIAKQELFRTDMFDEMGIKIADSYDQSSVPVSAYTGIEALKKLDSLGEQTRYLNEQVSDEEVLKDIDDAGLGFSGLLLKMGIVAEDIAESTHLVRKRDHTRAEYIQAKLDYALSKGDMTEERHAELSRYIYELSQGGGLKAYPCMFPNDKLPLNVWNQCLAANGFGTIKQTNEYNSDVDRGWHNLAAPLRRSTLTKYESGEVGDVLQLMVSYIDMSIALGNSEYFGISANNASGVTSEVISNIYNNAEGYYASKGQVHNLVDLTNNKGLYSRKGGEADGKTWNPSNPSPETTTDLRKSKQYEMLGVLESLFSKELGEQIQFTDEMKMKIAGYVRQISSGKKHSIKAISDKELRDRTAKEAMQNIETMIGVQL